MDKEFLDEQIVQVKITIANLENSSDVDENYKQLLLEDAKKFLKRLEILRASIY